MATHKLTIEYISICTIFPNNIRVSTKSSINMGKQATAYELRGTLAKTGYTTRDSELRCIRCGSFSAGIPLCNECTDDVMKVIEERRLRMHAIFYSIIFFGILAYYFVI